MVILDSTMEHGGGVRPPPESRTSGHPPPFCMAISFYMGRNSRARQRDTKQHGGGVRPPLTLRTPRHPPPFRMTTVQGRRGSVPLLFPYSRNPAAPFLWRNRAQTDPTQRGGRVRLPSKSPTFPRTPPPLITYCKGEFEYQKHAETDQSRHPEPLPNILVDYRTASKRAPSLAHAV